MKTKTIDVLTILLVAACGSVSADIVTNFDGGSLDPALQFDEPNSGLGTFSLDVANNELDVFATGNTDMWTTRNNAPFAWTAKPVVGVGETWIAETHVRIETPAVAGKVSGLTVYGGPDGANAQFGFSLDNWNPAARAVRLQGLGTNAPNISVPWANDNVFLRMEVTENTGTGGADVYNFFFKEFAGDGWTQLGGAAIDFDAFTIDNSRVALVQKTSANGGGSAFSYFNVTAAVPEPTTGTLVGLGLLVMQRRLRRR